MKHKEICWGWMITNLSNRIAVYEFKSGSSKCPENSRDRRPIDPYNQINKTGWFNCNSDMLTFPDTFETSRVCPDLCTTLAGPLLVLTKAFLTEKRSLDDEIVSHFPKKQIPNAWWKTRKRKQTMNIPESKNSNFQSPWHWTTIRITHAVNAMVQGCRHKNRTASRRLSYWPFKLRMSHGLWDLWP